MLSGRMKYTLLAVIFLLGYTSLSFELIVLRQMINFIGSNTLITSIVITFILLFMSVGYYIGSVINLSHCPARRYMRKLSIMLVGWYMISCTYYMMELYFFLMYNNGIRSVVGSVFLFSILFLAFPSVCLGFITSVIGRFLHRADSNYTGRFMAVDTMGSVLGSIMTTLVVMPIAGVSKSVIFLTCLAALAALLLTPRRSIKSSVILVTTLLLISCCVNSETIMNSEQTLVKDDAISRIEIIPQQGDSLLLQVNGSASSKISSDENQMFEYIKFINRQYIETLPKDAKRDILVLGAGGFTIGLNDTFHNYTFLDIDKDLKTITEKDFLKTKLSPNKQFIAEDAFLFMLNTKNKYDIIIVDVYSSARSIPINFVTTDFFLRVKAGLKENGIMIANIITSPALSSTFSRRIDNTLRYVFPTNLERYSVTPFNPYLDNQTGNVEYVYYNRPKDEGIFTLDKNKAIFGQW